MSVNLEKKDYGELYLKYAKRWLTPQELEKEYGFNKSSQAKMRMFSNSSNLPFSKVGKFIRYDRIEIDMWLEEHRVQGE